MASISLGLTHKYTNITWYCRPSQHLNKSVHTPIHMCLQCVLNPPREWLLSTLIHSNVSIPPPPLWQCSLSMMKPLLVPLWNPCVGMTLRVLCVLCLCVCYSGWPPQPFVPIDFADADGERSSKGGSGWACGGSGGWQPGPLAYGGKRRGRRSGQWGLKLGSTLLSSFAEGQAGLLDVWARNGRPQSPRPSTGLPERPPTAPQLQRKCEWLAWSLISDLFDLYANCQPSYLFLSG